MNNDTIIGVVIAVMGAFLTSLVTTTKILLGIEDRALKRAEEKTRQLLAETQLQSNKELQVKFDHIKDELAEIKSTMNGGE
jgi:mannitol-specific phosphotransferase system IIBC component